jgi:hypothetical protein
MEVIGINRLIKTALVFKIFHDGALIVRQSESLTNQAVLQLGPL